MQRSMNALTIQICASYKEAPNYKENGEGFKHVTLKKGIVVRDGMENGNDSIDLQFVDEEGNKFVAMTTAKLLKSLTDVTVTYHDD